MRTTLTIDDDILQAAKTIAREEEKSVGTVVSELARQGLEVAHAPGKRKSSGVPVFRAPAKSKPITLEDVKMLEDEF